MNKTAAAEINKLLNDNNKNKYNVNNNDKTIVMILK